MIKIRSKIVFKTIALKSAVNSEFVSSARLHASLLMKNTQMSSDRLELSISGYMYTVDHIVFKTICKAVVS